MPESVLHLIPNPEHVLALEPEELAGYLMEYFNSLPKREQDQQLNRNNFGGSLFYNLQHCPSEYRQLSGEQREEITQAFMEAWFWLEREGLLVPKPGPNRDFFFTSRRGRQIKNVTDLKVARRAYLLPKQLLHPVIAQKIWSLFIRGEYDTAVFQAFKEVEMSVRDTGGFSPDDIGTDLMRKAFHPSSGPLRDPTKPKAEREALAHLFAGAIGLYKNPSSHRHAVSDPGEAVEMIVLANHLLCIVESRRTP